VAARAFPQGPTGQCLKAIAVVCGRIGRGDRRHTEQHAATIQLARAVTVAEEAVIADAMKSARQHMDQEAPDELRTGEGHRLLAIAVAVILPAEADLAVFHGQQTVVGDGDTVGIAPDVVENLRRPGEGPLGVDDPAGVPKRRQVTLERGGFMEVAVRGEEIQRAGGERLREVVQEQAAKHRRQHRDRQKKPRPAGNPALPSGAIPPPGTRK
jgi:hypothetical protein